MVTRTFESGANRNSEEGKLDYEGFLSPLVLRRYAQYMNHHRKLEDGTLRASDNWQKGMPPGVYMKSLLRHVMDAWTIHRGWLIGQSIEVALCAILFNANGYLHEIIKARTLSEAKQKEPMADKLYPDGIPKHPGTVKVFLTPRGSPVDRSGPLDSVAR